MNEENTLLPVPFILLAALPAEHPEIPPGTRVFCCEGGQGQLCSPQQQQRAQPVPRPGTPAVVETRSWVGDFGGACKSTLPDAGCWGVPSFGSWGKSQDSGSTAGLEEKHLVVHGRQGWS